MRTPRQISSRTRLALAQWLPCDSRQFGMIVLAVFAAVALGLFTRW